MMMMSVGARRERARVVVVVVEGRRRGKGREHQRKHATPHTGANTPIRSGVPPPLGDHDVILSTRFFFFFAHYLQVNLHFTKVMTIPHQGRLSSTAKLQGT